MAKTFHPLAFTKSFAMLGVAILSITLVPAMIPTFIKGRLRSEAGKLARPQPDRHIQTRAPLGHELSQNGELVLHRPSGPGLASFRKVRPGIHAAAG